MNFYKSFCSSQRIWTHITVVLWKNILNHLLFCVLMLGAVCQISRTQQYFHSNFSEVKSAQSLPGENLRLFSLLCFLTKITLVISVLKYWPIVKTVSIVQSGNALNEIFFSIFHLCLQRKNSLDIAWIPRSLNEKADILSKLVDYDDWSVS